MHQTTKQYILPLVFGTLLALAGFTALLIYVNPYQTQLLSLVIFFISCFLWISGAVTLTGLLTRKKFFPGIFLNQFEISLRQGILIGALVTGLLLLETFNVLFWWTGLTYILFIISLEFFLGSN